MPYHVVKQGECLSSIARRFGFSNWRTIYDHIENTEFRQLRPNPNLLYPGDRLFIPEREQREERGATEQRHRFKRRGEPTRLKIRLIDSEGEPLTNKRCLLEAGSGRNEAPTDDEGCIEINIPPETESGILLLHADTDSGEDEWMWNLQLGHLDPIDEVSGVQGRLNNLGFDCGPVDGISGPRTEAAVREFQGKYNLTVDGIAGPQTKGRLTEVHDE
jgi:hypothetical protein